MKSLSNRLEQLEAKTPPEGDGLRIVITRVIMEPGPDGPVEVRRLRKVVDTAHPGGEATTTVWHDVDRSG
jgi:hypothetical protein